MNVTVNGQPRTIPDGMTVSDLLKDCGVAEKPCAVEVNQTLVPKRSHETTSLNDGDRIELVTLVGGG